MYYAYLEMLIFKGKVKLGMFIKIIKNHKTNKMNKIKEEDMFNIIITVAEQLYQKLVVDGIIAAFRHLFQSVLLIPEFDRV